MADNDFIVPDTDGFLDAKARNYMSNSFTGRLEVLEYSNSGDSDDTEWKFHAIMQGMTEEDIIKKSMELSEKLNVHARLLAPVFNYRGRVIDRRVVWSN